jgi:hypothetical protein
MKDATVRYLCQVLCIDPGRLQWLAIADRVALSALADELETQRIALGLPPVPATAPVVPVRVNTWTGTRGACR